MNIGLMVAGVAGSIVPAEAVLVLLRPRLCKPKLFFMGEQAVFRLMLRRQLATQ